MTSHYNSNHQVGSCLPYRFGSAGAQLTVGSFWWLIGWCVRVLYLYWVYLSWAVWLQLCMPRVSVLTDNVRKKKVRYCYVNALCMVATLWARTSPRERRKPMQRVSRLIIVVTSLGYVHQESKKGRSSMRSWVGKHKTSSYKNSEQINERPPVFQLTWKLAESFGAASKNEKNGTICW